MPETDRNDCAMDDDDARNAAAMHFGQVGPDLSKRVTIHGLRHGPTICIDPKCPIKTTHPAHPAPRKSAR